MTLLTDGNDGGAGCAPTADAAGEPPAAAPVRRATDRVRLADVAAAAGVAVSTVSRVFSDPDRVNFQTVEHVKTVADRLGYRPRPRRGDAPGKPAAADGGMIALVVKDSADGVCAQILKGAQLAATAAHRIVGVVEAGADPRWTLDLLARLPGRIDGLILASDEFTVRDIRALAARLPLTVVNRPVEGVASVIPDPALGVAKALTMLRRLGHTSVTYVAGPSSWADQSRWECVQRAGLLLGVRTRRIGPVRPDADGGHQAALALEGAPPTAVITYNDAIAAGLITRFAADGVDVPGRVSVVAFDNTMVASAVVPAVTTIRLQRELIGECAVRSLLGKPVGRRLPDQDAQLLRRLDEAGVRERYDGSVTAVPTSLIVRRSVGPCRDGL
ncbi:LacI family DNA-binding transcriptional regulator [Bifidobacterium samirii]|uniref:Transcriptional regulator, LacI family n=1 Tax=Bifidobacterium samirii TaxID=2306974 RepID=A0A430FWJ5_9BIFI|nr:LacI family DNA-binding transcriptional regulator [Bifidobacterium samirii]RSX58513.1 transcriptional regulator, LacI family [Bifidobacterium samirii]